jgi:hypothetical protein
MSTMEEPERPRRPSLIADPLRTTAVLLAIIAVLAGAQHLLSDAPTTPVRPIEYAPAAEAARAVAPFDVLAPKELPQGWRATSVRYAPGDEATWHLGVLTDQDKYVGVEQAVGTVEGLVESYAAESEPDGSVDVGGDTWQVLRDGDETTLVHDDGGSATLVTGDAPQADVELMVELLEP